MSENKVGSDVLGLGGLPQSGLVEKKRQELLRKLREEKAKKSGLRNLDDLEGQQVNGDIPNDQKRPDVRDGRNAPEIEKAVNVREHRRKPPRKGNAVLSK